LSGQNFKQETTISNFPLTYIDREFRAVVKEKKAFNQQLVVFFGKTCSPNRNLVYDMFILMPLGAKFNSKQNAEKKK